MVLHDKGREFLMIPTDDHSSACNEALTSESDVPSNSSTSDIETLRISLEQANDTME